MQFLYFADPILYINSLVCASVCRGPETQINFNKTVPSNSRAQKLLRTSSSYFYLRFRTTTVGGPYFLLLRSFVEVLKPRSILIKLSPRTRRPKNYSRLQVLISYFYFYVCFCAATVGGPYFLLLRSFPRNNYCRQWGRYFWDLEGG